MTRTCSICNHKDIAEINKLLLSGESYRSIAKRFEASESAVYRHKESHIPESLLKSNVIQETVNADSLVGQIEGIRGKIKSLLEKAITTDSLRDAHNFVGDTLRQIELEGKILGKIQEQNVNVNLQQVSIYSSPEWLAVGSALARVLAGHPELRAEVAEELLALEHGGQP